MHLDISSLVHDFGYIGLFVVIFAECGLLIGLVFPGDSLLFSAGLFAAKGDLNIVVLVPVLFAAAVLGLVVGYWFGWVTGPKLFARDDARLFKKSYVQRTQDFYDKYGARTIVISRFVPIVRTLAPILAGVARMRFARFLVFNMIGAALWAGGVTIAGYELGKRIPSIDRYLLPMVVGIVVLSLIPPAIEIIRARRHAREEAAGHTDGQPVPTSQGNS